MIINKLLRSAHRITIIPYFFSSSNRLAAFLSRVIGLWEMLSIFKASSLSLLERTTSKISSLMLLLARLILLTPCRCSVIFKNPDEVKQLRVSFIPLILCNLLARCTYSTSLSLESLHSDRSKKSVKVFLMNF